MEDDNPYVYVFNSPVDFIDPTGRVVQYIAPGCTVTYNKPPVVPELYDPKKGATNRAAPLTEQKVCDLQKCSGQNLTITGGSEPGHRSRAHKEGRAVDFGFTSNPLLRDPSAAGKFLCCAKKSGFGFGIKEYPGSPKEHFHLEALTVTNGKQPDLTRNILPNNTCGC